jgi:hypothetical protein
MTRAEQDTARVLSERLIEQGVTRATVSQVAKYLDQVQAWERGDLPLESLATACGWPRPDLGEDATGRLDAAIARRLDDERAFRGELLAAKEAGLAVNEIARRVHAAGLASRPTVLQWLGAESLRDRAGRAIRSSGWNQETIIDVRRGGAVTVRIDQSLRPANRTRAAMGIEESLRKEGLCLVMDGTDEPPLTPAEDLADGTTFEITTV